MPIGVISQSIYCAQPLPEDQRILWPAVSPAFHPVNSLVEMLVLDKMKTILNRTGLGNYSIDRSTACPLRIRYKGLHLCDFVTQRASKGKLIAT